MINLYLPFYGIELRTSDFDPHINAKRLVEVYHKGLKLKMFDFQLDERDNTINIKHTTDLANKLKGKFNEFKNSNINYGNIGSGSEYEYDGTENISLNDFFEYLKSENRESIINQLI